MGLSRSGVAFVAAMARAGVDFSRTLTIGRQSLFADVPGIRAAFEEAGVEISREGAQGVAAPFAELLFERLGAVRVDSLDASDYEGATIVHDLNGPIPDQHRAAYTAVLDGGTLEHVFDLPTALRTVLRSVAVGGHYLAISPVSGQAGHGFYQLSPEFYHRVLSVHHGFRLQCMLWQGEVPGARWYRVADPEDVGRRVRRRSRMPALLFVAAQRIEDRPVLRTPPQQSDYVAAWRRAPHTARRQAPSPHSLALRSVARLTPGPVRRFAGPLIQAWGDRPNRADFERVRLADIHFED